MGLSQSTAIAKAEKPGGGNTHSAIPEDPVPFTGPQQEYRILSVQSKLKASLTGSSVSDVNEYINLLGQQYAEFFKLYSFFRVPYTQHTSGFMSVTLQYQAVFSRPSSYVASPESWQLQVLDTQLSLDNLMHGTLFGSNVGACQNGMTGIYEILTQQASLGGRLICLECTGQRERTGFLAMSFGVNLFFNIPQHPNPILYTNVALCVPMQVIPSFGGNVDVNLDINGPLAGYLNQGWKLIDIIIPQHETGLTQQRGSRGTMLLSQLNTVWFFEKEQARFAANDLTPLYQMTVVDVYLPVKVGIGGSAKANCELAQLLTEMGSRGWSLVCVLDTPKLDRKGMFGITVFLKAFFQRPLHTVNSLPLYSTVAPGVAPPALPQ